MTGRNVHVLGINAYHGNAAAALLRDGQLVAAAEEERFTRVKYAAGFPSSAIQYCLAEAGISIDDVDHVVIPRNPWARLGTKALHALRMPRFALDRSRALKRVLGIRDEIAMALGVDRARIRARFHVVEHHAAHLASTFFVSPFETAAVLSADGLGDFASTMWGIGRGGRLEVLGDVRFPHSLGIYYTALSQYLGFLRYGDEYKVMGLASYGEPAYLEEFRRIVHDDGRHGFRLDLDCFVHHRRGVEMTWRDGRQPPVIGRLFSETLERRLGPAREAGAPLERRHYDVAASLQHRLEEVLFRLLVRLHEVTGENAVCLAGGVAFNCVANGKIFERTPFERVYVQPAAGDAGLAIGGAYWIYHHVLGGARSFVMDHAYWGPGFSESDVRRTVEASGLISRRLPDDLLSRAAARAIADGQVVGWFQGRMEWGPRALGNRSIVADPRRADMREVLNRRVKHRESFRPFAPSVLGEAVASYFERSEPSPHMTFAYRVRADKRALIPAPTHVDGTGRLQTVDRATNPRYWQLIKDFEALTGVPLVLNTSFNDNEPIVCTPSEAVECFTRTHIDVLAIGNYMVTKPGAGASPTEPLP